MSTAEVYRRRRGRGIAFRVGEWMAEYRKTILSLLFFLILAGACVWFYIFFSTSDAMKNAVIIEEPEVPLMSISLSEGNISIPVPKLTTDIPEEISNTILTYYTALAEGDMDVIQELRPEVTDVELLFYNERSNFIEAYNNIVIYAVPGLAETDYVTFVTADTQIKDIETLAPELSTLYIHKNYTGRYLVYDGESGLNSDYESYISSMCELEEVNDLFTKVWVTYTDAIDANPALNDFLANFPEKLQNSVGRELAKLEILNAEIEGKKPGEDDISSTPETINRNEIVKTTTTVNVRKSDSATADCLGQATKGTQLTRVEDKANGWSRIIYQGSEAFIKSCYLEVVETVSDVKIIGSVTADKVVNVRADASTAANKVGIAYPGQTFELIGETDGWCKVIFEDVAAYIKGEYLTITKY